MNILRFGVTLFCFGTCLLSCSSNEEFSTSCLTDIEIELLDQDPNPENNLMNSDATLPVAIDFEVNEGNVSADFYMLLRCSDSYVGTFRQEGVTLLLTVRKADESLGNENCVCPSLVRFNIDGCKISGGAASINSVELEEVHP